MGNIKTRSVTVKSEQTKNDFIVEETKKATVKSSTRNRKRELADETESSLDIIKSKVAKSPKNINKTKSSNKTEELKKSESFSTEEREEASGSKKIKQELKIENWEPTNWQLMLENIRKMRANDKAPVDSMGCHKCADENADEKVCTL